MEKIKVVLVDDHVLVRKGIKAMLDSDQEIDVIGEGNNGVEAVDLARKLKPDIMILDIRMPEKNGLEAAAEIQSMAPATKALILSMHDSEDYVLQALNSGAYGYLLKDTDKNEFVKALKQVHQGIRYFSGAVSNILANQLLSHTPATIKTPMQEDSYHLTRRERQILSMISNGKHNKDIAEALENSVRTVETHRFNIMKKLGVNNAVDMVNKAIKENLV
ncbi:MAG: response regulator transcription factor [Cyclobacteriaceae bacterium]|nr:response regulator transcription factor [Cyclobacteriaceae bacterium]